MDIGIADEANNDVTDQEPRLYYPNVEQFVTQMLAQQYRRPVDLAGRGNTFTWCSKWWLHAEAVSRLTALWRAWEASRLDPTTGMIVWWRDHADTTMRVLFAQDGTLRRLHTPRTQTHRHPSASHPAANRALRSGLIEPILQIIHLWAGGARRAEPKAVHLWEHRSGRRAFAATNPLRPHEIHFSSVVAGEWTPLIEGEGSHSQSPEVTEFRHVQARNRMTRTLRRRKGSFISKDPRNVRPTSYDFDRT